MFRRGISRAACCLEATHVPVTARDDSSNHTWHPGMWAGSPRPRRTVLVSVVVGLAVGTM